MILAGLHYWGAFLLSRKITAYTTWRNAKSQSLPPRLVPNKCGMMKFRVKFQRSDIIVLLSKQIILYVVFYLSEYKGKLWPFQTVITKNEDQTHS